MGKKIVKKIETKKGKYVIDLGDEKISLCQAFYMDELLYVGKVLTENDCARLSHLSALSEPYEYCIRLLSRGTYSSHTLREKLSLKYPECKDTNEIIYRLKKINLLDDYGYALAYKEAKESQLYGPKRILNELRYKKGIREEILNEIKFEDEEKTLNELFPLIDKRYKDLPFLKKAAKLERYFIDRGFSKEMAKKYSLKASIDEKEQHKRLKADYEKAKRTYGRKYNGYELRQRIIRSLLSKGYKMNEIEEISKDE